MASTRIIVLAHSGWGRHCNWPGSGTTPHADGGVTGTLGLSPRPWASVSIPPLNEMADTTDFDKQNACELKIEQSRQLWWPTAARKPASPQPCNRKSVCCRKDWTGEVRDQSQSANSIGLVCFSAGQPLVTLVSRTWNPCAARQALKAWPLVLEQRPDAQLLLVGDPNRARIRHRTAHRSHPSWIDALAGLPITSIAASIHVLGVLDHPPW